MESGGSVNKVGPSEAEASVVRGGGSDVGKQRLRCQ